MGRFYENCDFKYFLQIHECKKSPQVKVKIKKWLEEPELAKQETFVKRWHYFLNDAGKVLDEKENLEAPGRILVKVPYTKGLDGTNLMILKDQDALIIANLMMGGNGDPTGMAFDEITISAISEAMNQMCGRIATSMSEILHKPTDIGFPLINSKYKTTFVIPDELCNGTDIVKVTFRLTVDGLINSTIWQLYPLSIVKQILDQEGI